MRVNQEKKKTKWRQNQDLKQFFFIIIIFLIAIFVKYKFQKELINSRRCPVSVRC